MLVSVALFEIHIPYAQSLKDKRMVVKSLRDKLRNRFEISAGEVGLHDVHQRARLGLSFVSIDDASADGMLDRVAGRGHDDQTGERTRNAQGVDRRL